MSETPVVNLDSIIPGLRMCAERPSTAVNVLVLAKEKSGKSTLAATLLDWPEKGRMPIVLAVDPTGPDSCASIGRPVPSLVVAEQAGADFTTKMDRAISAVQRAFRAASPFCAIIVDDASTLMLNIFNEDKEVHPSKDQRQNYRRAADVATDFQSRLLGIGVPVIFLAWVREGWKEEEDGRVKVVLGGPLIEGQKFRTFLSGKAHAVLILEKYRTANKADPGLCGDGFGRRFHTRQWEMIEAASRYDLPEPCPANLAFVLDWMINRPGEMARAAAEKLRAAAVVETKGK